MSSTTSQADHIAEDASGAISKDQMAAHWQRSSETSETSQGEQDPHREMMMQLGCRCNKAKTCDESTDSEQTRVGGSSRGSSDDGESSTSSCNAFYIRTGEMDTGAGVWDWLCDDETSRYEAGQPVGPRCSPSKPAALVLGPQA